MKRARRSAKKKAVRKSIRKKKSRNKPAGETVRKTSATKKDSARGLVLELRTTKRLPPEAVKKLFRAAGWKGDLARYSAKKVRLKLNRSHVVVTAWQGKELVGFGSAISDGVLCALVDNLVVHPGLRSNGIGRALLQELSRTLERQGVEYIFGLGTRSKSSNTFFEGAGFRSIPWRVFLHAPK